MLELYQIAFVPGNLGKDLYGKDPSPNVRAKSGDTVPQTFEGPWAPHVACLGLTC